MLSASVTASSLSCLQNILKRQDLLIPYLLIFVPGSVHGFAFLFVRYFVAVFSASYEGMMNEILLLVL